MQESAPKKCDISQKVRLKSVKCRFTLHLTPAQRLATRGLAISGTSYIVIISVLSRILLHPIYTMYISRDFDYCLKMPTLHSKINKSAKNVAHSNFLLCLRTPPALSAFPRSYIRKILRITTFLQVKKHFYASINVFSCKKCCTFKFFVVPLHRKGCF